MIELHADELRFSFPEIHAALRGLVEQHVSQQLPHILAEDHHTAVGTLFRTQWSRWKNDQQFRQRALREAAAFTPNVIIKTFHKMALEAAGLPTNPAVSDEGPAELRIDFQRTLRIPDDGKTYPLPVGLGRFPLRHTEDFTARLPEAWQERGGVMMPMYQAEALWINFRGYSGYPVALKIASGKINAVSGEAWRTGLNRPPQDYVAVPGQPWLDGFAVARGVIRQFVAMPLGGGHSVEEQLTGRAETGGIQLQAHPLRAEVYFRETVASHLPRTLVDVLGDLISEPPPEKFSGGDVLFAANPARAMEAPAPAMGLGAGGRMRQEIYKDTRPVSDWNDAISARCFVHLCNSAEWREITGTPPPQPPLTAAEYRRGGLPWFDFYREDAAALPGSDRLAKVKSVEQFAKSKGQAPLPGGGAANLEKVLPVGPARRPGQVREWSGD